MLSHMQLLQVMMEISGLQWGSNKIGRITLCGDIREYQIPTPRSEPNGLVLGPNGGIWFAEEADKIGQLVY